MATRQTKSRAGKAARSREQDPATSEAAPRRRRSQPTAGEQRQRPPAQRWPGWSDEDQIRHTTLWSAYVAASNYDAEQFRDRFQVRGIDEVADYLLEATSSFHLRTRSENLTPSIELSLIELGVWALAPHFYRAKRYEELRQLFHRCFGYDVATVLSDGPQWQPMPTLVDAGIDNPTIVTQAFRKCMQVRLEVVVLKPLSELRRFVNPWNWKLSPFWAGVPDPFDGADGREVETDAWVRLPGGRQAENVALKERPVRLTSSIVHSAFGARIDYQAYERTDDPRAGRYKELGDFRGFLSIEKLAGRPGCCRVVAEREVAFLNLNHDLFSRQTLWYWISSELIAIAHGASDGKP